jgi:hypothetical protein
MIDAGPTPLDEAAMMAMDDASMAPQRKSSVAKTMTKAMSLERAGLRPGRGSGFRSS